MKMRSLSRLALIVSIISLMFSIAAILIWKCEYKPMTWNLVDISVAVLSILVTVLIGWQIYNSVDINEKVKNLIRRFKIAKERSECQYNKISKAANNYNHTAKSFAQTLHTKSMFESGAFNVASAIDGFMTGLNEGLKGEDDDAMEFAIWNLDKVLESLYRFPEHDRYIYHNKRSEYLMILSQIKINKSCRELISFMSAVKECEEPNTNKDTRIVSIYAEDNVVQL